MIGRRDHRLMGVERDQRMALVLEPNVAQYRGIRQAAYHIRVLLRPDQETGLGHRRPERTGQGPLRRPELPDKHRRRTSGIPVAIKPAGVREEEILPGVIMGIHPLATASLREGRTADNGNLRIGLLDRLAEKLKAPEILPAIVLAADLDILQVERFRMPVPRTQGARQGIHRGVRVGDSVQGISRELIHRRDILVAGPAALARDPAINNVDRLRPHILAHLQVLVVAHAVRRTIGPYVPEMLTLRDIAQRLPPDRVRTRRIPLHETASGETDKTRGQGIDQRRQVRSQPVLPSLPRILREERYHIQPKHGGGIGRDRQDRVRRVLRSRKRMPVSFPLV